MLRRTALLIAALAGLAGLAAMPSGAAAQCRLCDTPTTARDQVADGAAIALDIHSRLDFDRLVVWGTGGGTAELRPDGSRSVSGPVGDISGRAMVGSAAVHGEPNRAVRIALPSTIALYSLSGGRVTIDDLVSDLPALPRLDSAGNLTFRFGGRLQVTGDAEGDYRGDIPITVEYL